VRKINQCIKETHIRFLRMAIWFEFMLTVLLITLLFPGSQYLYANPDAYPVNVTAESPSPPVPEKNPASPEAGPEGGEEKPSVDTEKPAAETEKPVPETGKPAPPPPKQEEETPASDPKDQAEASKPIFRGSTQAGKLVALTFDDGPYAGWTAEYLKTLEAYQVPATFFLVGTRVEKYPGIAQKIAEQGFEVGSHSYRHAKLTLEKLEIIQEDFRKTALAFSNIQVEIKLFRPPYGAYNDLVTGTADRYHQKSVGWNVDPRDWDTHDPQKIVNRVLSHVSDGSIILLHEGRKSTLEALPQIIRGLQEKGYRLVTVSQLIEAGETGEETSPQSPVDSEQTNFGQDNT